MATPLTFTAYTGWVDATDPNNIPAGTRLIAASDLLRYENLGTAVVARVNSHDTSITTNATNISNLSTTVGNNSSAISTLNNTVAGHTTSIGTNTADITNLKKYRALVTKTASYTAVLADWVILANGASITVTLPSAVTATAGKIFTVKNLNATSLTIASAAGTIDGAATKALAQWVSNDFVSDGANWFAV